MLFSSIIFIYIFLPIVILVYYAIPVKWRNIWLFGVNMVFYGWAEPIYIILMVASIVINYSFGLLIDKHHDDDKKAKRFMICSIVINVSILVFFKYTNLILESVSRIPGLDYVKPLDWLTLPIGISFYTFQMISYPVDVYRGDAYAMPNFVSFGTFVSLFPQLIAGPIVRFKDVSSQLDSRYSSIEKFASGVRRFTIGLAKKILIANNISKLWDVFSTKSAPELTILGSWLGIISFSFQLYFDFSGYSDMAIGLGRMIGFEFQENFNYPYVSQSITEFWRRWHISLSTWFRDYVYISLGGNRRGLPRQIINILIVWALTGIWHGANWTFLLWGLYYAFFLILEKTFMLDVLSKIPRIFRHIYTLVIVICGWVLFQLDTLSECFRYLGVMFGFGRNPIAIPTDFYYLSGFAVILITASIASTGIGTRLYARLPTRIQNAVTPALILAALIMSTAYLVDATYSPFLYFKF